MNYFSKNGISTLVLYQDDISSADVAALKTKLLQMLPMLSSEVVLSLGALDGLSGASLAVIIAFGNSVRQAGKNLTIRCLPSGAELLRFLGLERMANIAEEKAA